MRSMIAQFDKKVFFIINLDFYNRIRFNMQHCFQSAINAVRNYTYFTKPYWAKTIDWRNAKNAKNKKNRKKQFKF